MQLNLIAPTTIRREHKRTKRNVMLMQACYAEGHRNKWVSDEAYQKAMKIKGE